MEDKELKKLVIFYSLEGNTKFIAEGIKDMTGAESLELKVEKDISPKGFMRYVWGGSQVIMGKKPELMPIDKNPEDYDVLFIGTPIWAGGYVPAINTFLHRVQIKGKKIGLFCCHAGGGSGKAFSMFKEKLKENTIIGEIEFKDPLKNDKKEAEKQLKEWIDSIMKV